MSQVSMKKIRTLEAMLNGLLEDTGNLKVEEVMQCVTTAFEFSEEKHAQHMARQLAATKRYQEKQKNAGKDLSYRATRSQYYQAHKEEISKRYRLKRLLCVNNEHVMCGNGFNRRYNGYCSHCFRNLFPGDPRVKQMRTKSKEIKWVNALLDSPELSGYEWRWDKPLYVDFFGGCCATRRRIDLWTLVGHTIVAIEIDENQHKDRASEYEQERYNDLFMDFSGRYVFLRINPDSYRVSGKKQDPVFEERLELVRAELEGILADVESNDMGADSGLVTVSHMFYDDDSSIDTM
jgi:hypothetical protein